MRHAIHLLIKKMDDDITYITSVKDDNIKHLIRTDNKFLEQLLLYIFNRTGHEKYDLFKEKALETISDYEFYQYCLSVEMKNDSMSDKQDKEIQMKSYSKTLSLCKNIKIKNISKILDIGTEYTSFLDALSNKFKVKRKNVKGINIKNWDHYDKTSAQSEIIYYNGITIPFKREFDMVTLLSVLHHVPSIESFIKEVCRVSKKYIFLKEHNFSSEEIGRMIEIQHMFFIYRNMGTYEEIKDMDYMNYSFTKSFVLEEFKKHGFKKRNLVELNNFSNVYYLLLERE